MKNGAVFDLPQEPKPYSGRGRVLRVKEGFNPNSSSLGSVIFSIPAALVAAPVLLAGAAALLASRMARKADGKPQEPSQPSAPPRTEGGEEKRS